MNEFLEQNTSGFDEIRTAERTFNVELNGALPLTDFRDEQQTSGSGNIVDNESEYRLHHTTAGDFVRLASARRGSYQPGTQLQSGIGIRMDTSSISGDGVAYWGYFDMDETNTENIKNGLLYGLDKDGFFTEVIKDSTSKHKTYQKNFNKNSGSDIDLTDGNIFQLQFSYYGYGLIKFQYVDSQTGSSDQTVIDLHTVRLAGETSVLNPNLKVGALAKSSSNTGDFSVHVGGRQVSTIGEQFNRTRITTDRVESKSIGNSFEPIISFRKKQSFREVVSEIFGFSCISDQDIVLQIRVDADLTGASFGSLSEQPDDETAFEADTSATAVDTSTGTKVYETLVSGGERINSSALNNLRGVPVYVQDEGTITFAAKHISSSATVDFIGQIKERF